MQIAHDLLRREKYAEARAAFLAFAAQNPLDGRVPQLLFEVGQTYYVEKKFDEAIAAWETLAGKFPGTEPAGHAQFAIASILREREGRPGRRDRALPQGGGRALARPGRASGSR